MQTTVLRTAAEYCKTFIIKITGEGWQNIPVGVVLILIEWFMYAEIYVEIYLCRPRIGISMVFLIEFENLFRTFIFIQSIFLRPKL